MKTNRFRHHETLTVLPWSHGETSNPTCTPSVCTLGVKTIPLCAEKGIRRLEVATFFRARG